MVLPSRSAIATWMFQHQRTWLPLVALFIVVGVFAALDYTLGAGRFLSVDNLSIILAQNAYITVGALGMMLVIATGGIDLSAGRMLALSAAILACGLEVAGAEAARFSKEAEATTGMAADPWWLPWTPLLWISIALAAGSGCGLANGAMINGFRLPSFIVTLGTMSAFLGLAHILSRSSTVTPGENVIPGWLLRFVSYRDFHLAYGFLPVMPLGLFVELLIAIALAVMLRRTVFGRHLLAVGANETAARLCGIRVALVRTAVYTIAGTLFGLSGVYQFAMLGTYSVTSGEGKELDLIAAVVIGGGSLRGGNATVVGTLVGSLLMAVIRSGCTQLQIATPYQHIIIGSIIIAAVLFDRAAGRGE